MQPLGYSREELDAIHKTTKIQMEQKDIFGNVQFTLRNITFFLLYEKFHFGKVKLRNFAKGMAAYGSGCMRGTENTILNMMAFGVRTGYLSYLAAVLTVLRKQYRFSEKKLKEFMDLMQDHINSFYLGLFADDDLIEALSDEIGYQMKK